MTEGTIKLDTVEKVKDFSNMIGKIDGDYDISSRKGKYCIDAKSIMGIFSLDLSSPLLLTNADHTELDPAVVEIVKQFEA